VLWFELKPLLVVRYLSRRHNTPDLVTQVADNVFYLRNLRPHQMYPIIPNMPLAYDVPNYIGHAYMSIITGYSAKDTSPSAVHQQDLYLVYLNVS